MVFLHPATGFWLVDSVFLCHWYLICSQIFITLFGNITLFGQDGVWRIWSKLACSIWMRLPCLNVSAVSASRQMCLLCLNVCACRHMRLLFPPHRIYFPAVSECVCCVLMCLQAKACVFNVHMQVITLQILIMENKKSIWLQSIAFKKHHSKNQSL